MDRLAPRAAVIRGSKYQLLRVEFLVALGGLGESIPRGLHVDDLDNGAPSGRKRCAGTAVAWAGVQGLGFRPGLAVVVRPAGHDSSPGGRLVFQIKPHFLVRFDEVCPEHNRRGK